MTQGRNTGDLVQPGSCPLCNVPLAEQDEYSHYLTHVQRRELAIGVARMMRSVAAYRTPYTFYLAFDVPATEAQS